VIGDVILEEESSVWYGAGKFRRDHLVLGSPAKIKRQLSLEEQKDTARWAWNYFEAAKHFHEFYRSKTVAALSERRIIGPTKETATPSSLDVGRCLRLE